MLSNLPTLGPIGISAIQKRPIILTLEAIKPTYINLGNGYATAVEQNINNKNAC